jgi:hypothetical protein
MNMIKRSSLAVTFGALSLLAWAPMVPPASCEEKVVQPGKSPDQDPRAGMRREGHVVLEASDLDNIRGILGEVMTSATTRNLDRDVSYLAKADRDRLGEYAAQNADALKDKIATFRENWKAKYTTDFSFDSAKSGPAVFNYKIVPGESQKYARVTIPSSQNLPEVKLDLVNEGIITNAWRLDVPDTLSGSKLRDGLASALDTLNRDHASWPADKDSAYRLVAHHVLAAMNGVDLPVRS